MSDLSDISYDSMTTAEFEEHLPELITSGSGKTSENPQLATFFQRNPDCLALVRDLETIAETARGLFATEEEEPSDAVWSNIASKLGQDTEGEGAVDLTE